MRRALGRGLVALLIVACDRGRDSTPPIAATEPRREAAAPDVPDPPRPAADDADQALLLRVRRALVLPLRITATVRHGDAWLVAYSYDENEAWWSDVHRLGKAADVRATLARRRQQCEAAFRRPDEDPRATPDRDSGFHVDTSNAMDQRTCWERALGSLAPREGPLDGECDALGVARVTADTVESLFSATGTCIAEPAAFELRDVAGAGWPQLVLQYSHTEWGSTRLGFQPADAEDHLVILDPRPGHVPEMLAEPLRSQQLVDDDWHFSGSYAHVEITGGQHVTIYRQSWTASDECPLGSAGWAVAPARSKRGDDDDPWPCNVEWTVTRRAWDASEQRWSDTRNALPAPKRPPARAREFPVELATNG